MEDVRSGVDTEFEPICNDCLNDYACECVVVTSEVGQTKKVKFNLECNTVRHYYEDDAPNGIVSIYELEWNPLQGKKHGSGQIRQKLQLALQHRRNYPEDEANNSYIQQCGHHIMGIETHIDFNKWFEKAYVYHQNTHATFKQMKHQLCVGLHEQDIFVHLDYVIQKVLAQCSCQLNQIYRKGYHPLEIKSRKRPLYCWTVDLIHVKEDFEGYQYLIHVLDDFSKFSWMRPIQVKDMDGVLAYLVELMSVEGVPKHMKIDGGREFDNSALKALEMALLYKKPLLQCHFGKPHSHKDQGSNERVHREFWKVMKSCKVKYNRSWRSLTPVVVEQLNWKVSEDTKSTPFEIHRGISSYLRQAMGNINLEADELDYGQILQHKWDIVYPAINTMKVKYERQWKNNYNKSHRLIKYKPGQVVMVKDVGNSDKHEDRYLGPYVIVKAVEGEHKSGYVVGSFEDGIPIREKLYSTEQIAAYSHPPLPEDMPFVKDNDTRAGQKLLQIKSIHDIKRSGKDDTPMALVKHRSSADKKWIAFNNVGDTDLLKQLMGNRSKRKRDEIIVEKDVQLKRNKLDGLINDKLVMQSEVFYKSLPIEEYKMGDRVQIQLKTSDGERQWFDGNISGLQKNAQGKPAVTITCDDKDVIKDLTVVKDIRMVSKVNDF